MVMALLVSCRGFCVGIALTRVVCAEQSNEIKGKLLLLSLLDFGYHNIETKSKGLRQSATQKFNRLLENVTCIYFFSSTETAEGTSILGKA